MKSVNSFFAALKSGSKIKNDAQFCPFSLKLGHRRFFKAAVWSLEIFIIITHHWRQLSPAGGGQGVVVFNAVIIFISYALARLNPPPSLRDTSASGGHEMANSAIATQSLKGRETLCPGPSIF